MQDSKRLYNDTAYELSSIVTKNYSTSFSLSLKLLPGDIRCHIYNIYGLVRISDELVDTLRPKDCAKQLKHFREETNSALRSGVSTNPIVHAYVQTARLYSIPPEYLSAFFDSMAMDVEGKQYSQAEYERYIYGSAEVVGLMCLWVFVDGKKQQYTKLEKGAKSLGSAFQKVNFLRDLKDDSVELGRMYFPGVDFAHLTLTQKQSIQIDIRADLDEAKAYINKLPRHAKYGVLLAYYYYMVLYKKITRVDPKSIKTKRIRVANSYKLLLFITVVIRKICAL